MAPDQQHSPHGAQKSADLTTERVYWTRKELAARIGVSVDWIDRQVATRRIPYVKLSHKVVRFPIAAVEAWIIQQMSLPACVDRARPAVSANANHVGGQ